jgi:hypothetical protein
MQAVWNGRLTRTAASYGEIAPTATVCCNACRTCVTTNALALAIAAFASGCAALAGVVERLGRRS